MVSAAAKEKAQKIIDEHQVAIFSKSWCPYCRSAKATLTKYGAKFEALELDLTEDGTELQDALTEMTGQRTVPHIFINKKFIGGSSDLQAKEGELPRLLKAPSAL